MAKLVGILNITTNSFSDGGKYASTEAAISRVHELFKEGADLVDIGAVSTSYEAELINHSEEWGILEPILKSVEKPSLISIDTYHYQTAEKAINLGARFINDVSFGLNDNMLRLIAEAKVKYILMHSLVLPANKNIRVKNINEIEQGFESKIEECLRFGISLDQIIVDPGIGFGTNPSQSFKVLRSIEKFKKFGTKILIGHSRKSFLEIVSNYPPHERDLETLTASLHLRTQVDYLRIHNVNWHKRAFNVAEALNF